MKPRGATGSIAKSGSQITDPVTKAWSSPTANAAETPPARIHPSGPPTLQGDWLTRYRPVPPTSTTKPAQPSSVTRTNGSPRSPAAHVPESHRKRMREPMKSALPSTCGRRRTGRSRRQGQIQSPAVTSPFSKMVIPSEISTGQRETGKAISESPESAISAREVPMSIHPRRSAGTSRARDSDITDPTANRRPMITVTMVRIVAGLLSASSAPTAATKRPANATGRPIGRGSLSVGVPMTRIVAPHRRAAADLPGSARSLPAQGTSKTLPMAPRPCRN
jgi:hypothetical protein